MRAPGEPDGVVTLPIEIIGTTVADAAPGSARAEWNADRAVTSIYSEHYRSLVRLAAFLVNDIATAEEVVQDSFAAMHRAWSRLWDSDKALAYLRQSVLKRSRSAVRHRKAVHRDTPKPSRGTVVAALRDLPARQREALVLRHYGNLSEVQIASVMGISAGAVTSHIAHAMAALQTVLEHPP
jgi:DNA-directed RNA polymerase specialized sigma24 family protein